MKRQEFYELFEIPPVKILSDCQYENEQRCGIEFGQDCCPHIEDDISCETCDLSTPKYKYYPPISYRLLIQLLLICGTQDVPANLTYYDDVTQPILDMVKNKIEDADIKTNIKQVLQQHCQEYARC